MPLPHVRLHAERHATPPYRRGARAARRSKRAHSLLEHEDRPITSTEELLEEVVTAAREHRRKV